MVHDLTSTRNSRQGGHHGLVEWLKHLGLGRSAESATTTLAVTVTSLTKSLDVAVAVGHHSNTTVASQR
jgi:hypothetical protein